MALTQATNKERALDIVRDLPDDSSFDQILKEIAFERMIDRGLADEKAGRLTSHAEVGKLIDSWAE